MTPDRARPDDVPGAETLVRVLRGLRELPTARVPASDASAEDPDAGAGDHGPGVPLPRRS